MILINHLKNYFKNFNKKLKINFYHPYRFIPMNKNKAGKILQDANSKLSNFWVSAGTALGLYRDKDFITGDTDIDIEMMGFKGIEKYIKKTLKYKLIRSVYYNKKIQQMAFTKNDILFDIYFYYKEGNKYINQNELGKMEFPCKYFDNLELIQTKYGKLPFPSPIEEYLKIRYGNWQTPSNKKGMYGNDF